MSRQIPPDGDYPARRTGKIVIKEEKSGALMVYIPCALVGSEVPWQGKQMFCIGSKDGTPQQNNIDDLCKIWLDWDGTDLNEGNALEETPLTENGVAEFVLAKCYDDDSYTPEGESEPVHKFKARFINPLGGGMKMPEPMEASDRKRVITKWSSKLKAVRKNTPKKPEADDSANDDQPPMGDGGSDKPSRPAKPGKKVRTETVETVWDLYQKANPVKKGGDAAKHKKSLEAKFWEAADEIDDTGELTPEQWGTLADTLKV